MSRFSMIPYPRNSIANYFDDLERTFFSGFPSADTFRTDVIDKGDHFLLQAELPGVDKENIHIDVEDNCLTLTAQHEDSKEETQENYLRRERVYGSYKRQFDVSNVDVDNIDACYKDGVLELKLPKKSEQKGIGRQIDIH